MVDPAGPGTGVVNQAIAKAVGSWSTKYNAAINYGYDPGGGHVSPGHNVTRTATDTGPAAGWAAGTGLFERGLRAILGQVDQILYGTAGIGTPYDNHGRGNHAHIEWGMQPDVQSAIVGSLKLPRFKGKFFQGGLGAAGLNKRSAAMEKIMARRAGAAGGGPDMGPMTASGQYSKSELMSLWTQANQGQGSANVMAAIALAESGGDPAPFPMPTLVAFGRFTGLLTPPRHPKSAIPSTRSPMRRWRGSFWDRRVSPPGTSTPGRVAVNYPISSI